MDVCLLINQLAPGGAPTLLLDIVRYTDATYTVCFVEGDDDLVGDFERAGARVGRLFGARRCARGVGKAGRFYASV